MEPGLFRHRGFSAALVVGVVFFAAISGLMLVLTLHLQVGLGYSALHAGDPSHPYTAAPSWAQWPAVTNPP